MPLFNVNVERTYTARHLVSVLVDAPNEELAQSAAQAALDEGELDPTELPYRDTQESEGYDKADGWEATDAGAADVEALWAGTNGRCRLCDGNHYTTKPCDGATEVHIVDFQDGEG